MKWMFSIFTNINFIDICILIFYNSRTLSWMHCSFLPVSSSFQTYIYIYVSDFFCVTCFLLVLCCLCNVTFIYTSSLDFLKRGYSLTLADHWVCWCLLFLCNSNLFLCMADIFFFCKYLRQAVIKSPKRFSCEMFINQCATGMLFSMFHLWLQLAIMRSIFVKDFSGRCHKGCSLWSTLASSLYFWAGYCQYKWSLSSTASFVWKGGKTCTAIFTLQWINTVTNEIPAKSKQFCKCVCFDICLG